MLSTINVISICRKLSSVSTLSSSKIRSSNSRIYSDTPAKLRYKTWGDNNRDNNRYNARDGNDVREGRDSDRDGRSDSTNRNGNTRSWSNSGNSMDRPQQSRQRYDNNYISSNNYRDQDYRYNKDNREKFPPAYGHYDGDHIYGVSPVLSAMTANKRNISELLIQENMDVSNKKDDKSANEILRLAKDRNIPIREFSKHDLNTLTDNKVHQGFVLRAENLNFKRIDFLESSNQFKCVLALDEVWDPQNFGALLRTCHFLGIDRVVSCAKNSAPLSTSVSKASAGALEFMEVSSADNMMKFLDKSKENGWQVIGTALSNDSIGLNEIPIGVPTIIVLGNEGHGIRTNILRRCSHLVKISSGSSTSASSVDSLNVSVTGGIILHHVINANK